MAQQYTYGPLNINGGTDVDANGINASGEVVGTDIPSGGGALQGFADVGGTITTIAVPGTTSATNPYGVNASGEIVGSYEDASGATHGFLDVGGTYTSLDIPGATSTTATGVTDSGQEVVGYYTDTSGVTHGFLDVGGTANAITAPGATSTEIFGVNNAGDYVGVYVEGGVSHAFEDIGGQFEDINVPGATSSSARGINDSDQIAGTYADANGVIHGFVDSNGSFTTLDVPGSAETGALSINDAGQVGVQAADGSGDIATPVCFGPGTLIRTTRGDLAVESLAVGDLAVTAAGEHRRIRWIGHRDMDFCRHPRPHEAMPVRIAAHAFGENRPSRDLLLSPGHPVLVGAGEDGAGGHLVPVMCLINGTSIGRVAVDSVTYWHIELDEHDILLADDLPAESYLDWGDRGFFTEGSDHVLANPDFVVPGLSRRCRPVAVAGPVVDAERRRLDTVFAMQLAGACGWPSVEDSLRPAY